MTLFQYYVQAKQSHSLKQSLPFEKGFTSIEETGIF